MQIEEIFTPCQSLRAAKEHEFSAKTRGAPGVEAVPGARVSLWCGHVPAGWGSAVLLVLIVGFAAVSFRHSIPVPLGPVVLSAAGGEGAGAG